MFIAILAWAPFPFGSNRGWSWSLICLLIVLCWLVWLASVWARPHKIADLVSRTWIPVLLAVLALGWSALQVASFVPQGWAHPLWQLAADTLGHAVPATISISPWRTTTESMKLLTYAMALWLAFAHAVRPDKARTLLISLVVIGVCYAFYAFVLASFGISQLNIVYGGSGAGRDIAGPFVNHNSFATYAGLATLCASALLVEAGWSSITIRHGGRRLLLSVVQYLFGRGIPYLLFSVVAISAVIATGSRAGTFSTAGALLVLLMIGGGFALRQTKPRWISTVGLGLFAAVAILFVMNGDVLARRLNDIGAAGVRDDTRLMLWHAALRMIHDAPILGLGLGTYERAYPMYSDTMLPLFMDKAHNDYLELAAGWGLPASLLWLGAIIVFVAMCVRALQRRHRDRLYPIVAIGATVLVGLHSLFDFSLQMPAISLTYATLLGMGVAQSFSTRAVAVNARTEAVINKSITRFVALLPAIVVAGLAGPRFVSGLAQEAAAPVTTRMLTNTPLALKFYTNASELLSHTSHADGEAQILRAEAMALVEARSSDVYPVLETGLERSPASARGWLIFSGLTRSTNPAQAYAAYSLGTLIAPREYYLIVPRVMAGAPLWNRLSERERQLLVADTRQVLNDINLSSALHRVLTVEGGAALVTRAYAGHPEALRGLNRAMARQRLGI